MKIKILLLSALIMLTTTSCLEDKPLEDDDPGAPETLLSVQNAFVKATNGLTPESMKKDEWALFKIYARLYTGEYQGLGYRAAQVLKSEDGIIQIESDSYDIKDLNILVTDYAEPESTEETPPIDLQKEWNCKFVKPPYYLWYGDCELPPEQNFWVFNSLTEPSTPIFYGLQAYTKKQKLPQIMVDEGRCYGFENCEIDVNYLEYNMVGLDENGKKKRLHYVTSFSGELPYLASNLKTCYSTLLNVDGKFHPAEVCQELINFTPGQ